MPTVSVIIASYNHESYVAETLQSVLDQSYQDFEIVITDDGSTDGTIAAIRKFADPRIQLACLERNSGACVALAHCLDRARGRYIAVLNSDDAFLPGKLATQVRFLDDHPDIGAVFGLAQFVDQEGRPISEENHQYARVFTAVNRDRYAWLHHFFAESNCLCHPSVLLRRECYETVGYYDPRLAQLPDLDFWVRLCMRYEIHILPQELVRFRLCPTNASAATPEHLARDTWEFRHILNHYLAIARVDEFRRVFPEAHDLPAADDPDLIPLAVALIALRNTGPKSHLYRAFAAEALFHLLADAGMAQKVSTQSGFRYADFLRLTGQIETAPASRRRRSRRLPSRSWLRSVVSKLARFGRSP